MGALFKILAYAAATMILGALISPPMYWAGQMLGARQHQLAWLGETEFQRYFDRGIFIAALCLFFPTAMSLRVGSWRELGLRPSPAWGWHLIAGFLVGAGALWAFGGLLWAQGVYVDKGLPPTGTLVGFCVTALVVGGVEETFFRGALLGLIRRTTSDAIALWSVSILFAVLHFLKPPEDALRVNVTWLSGFGALARACWQFREAQLVVGGLSTLLLVGLILGWVRLRTQSLWLPIGLHAGWIFALKSFSRSSRHVAAPTIVFGRDMITGLGPVCLLTISGAVLWVWLRKREHVAA